MPISIDVSLNIGENTIEWKEATGFADLKAKINVTQSMLSCVSMNDGVCSLSPPEPYISFPSTWAVKGWLSERVADFDSWVESKGGSGSIELGDVFEITDGFLTIVDLGFTVSLSNVFNATDYYLGIG